MSKLAALQERHDSASFGLDDLPADALYAQGIICSKAKKVDGKTKAIAFDTRSDEFLLNADGSFLLFKDWKQQNGIGRKAHKTHANKGTRYKKQPGDAVGMGRNEVRDWLNGMSTDYEQPIPADDVYVRVNSPELAPITHPVPESCVGENAYLKALRGWLRCYDKDYQRIIAGILENRRMRDRDYETLDLQAFRERWVIGEAQELDSDFTTVVSQHDSTGPALVSVLPELTAKPFVPQELEVCSRPCYIPLPLSKGQVWRPGQQDVAAAVFSGDNTLAVLPTGYGKTLAFTYPLVYEANCLDEDKLTVIVVPTNTLKQQMVQQLEPLRPVYFGAGIKGRDLEQRLAGLSAGAFGVAIVSPEHLVHGSQVLTALRGCKVQRIVFDEAHCLLTWQFRTAYGSAAEVLRTEFPGVQRCAFTATLPKGQEDELMQAIGCTGEYLTFRANVSRNNLQIIPVQHVQEEYGAVRQLLDQLSGKTLVMVNAAHSAKRLAAMLGGRARPYFTGDSALTRKLKAAKGQKARKHFMEPEKRQANSDWFRDTDGAVLVATKAYGLGIDLSDIQNVILCYVPEDLSELVQIAGRAGRGGQPARVIPLWSRKALAKAPAEVADFYRPENSNWEYLSRFM
ncbi:DEAD/DEAH box helicase [Enterobacter hormaechei]